MIEFALIVLVVLGVWTWTGLLWIGLLWIGLGGLLVTLVLGGL